MNKLLMPAACVLSAAVFAVSCSRGGVPAGLSDRMHSGFGYAGDFFREGAQVTFTIESDRDMTVPVTVRCKCFFSHDAASCVMVSGSRQVPIVIPETGKWCETVVETELEKGLNHILITGAGPMKSDVLIDYIEY